MYSVLILTWKAMIATQQVLCNPAGATMHLRRCFSFPVLFTLVFIAVNKVLFCSCSSFALHSLKQHCYTGERRRQVHRPQSLKQHCYTGEREQKQHCYTGERVPWPDIWTTSARALPGWPSRHIIYTRHMTHDENDHYHHHHHHHHHGHCQQYHNVTSKWSVSTTDFMLHRLAQVKDWVILLQQSFQDHKTTRNVGQCPTWWPPCRI